MIQVSQKHVHNAIQALLLFSGRSVENGILSKTHAEELKENCIELLEKLTRRLITTEEAAYELNQWIDDMNKSFKEKTQAPYPFLATKNAEMHMRSEVIAFEHYLNQQLLANRLPLQIETALFHEAYIVWKEVGVTLTPKQGAKNLAQIIQKLNASLNMKEHYPMPDESY